MRHGLPNHLSKATLGLMAGLPLSSKRVNLIVELQITKGKWGVVHAGRIDGQPVVVKAIKDLLETRMSKAIAHYFYTTCDRLKKFEHPNVISECCNTKLACARVASCLVMNVAMSFS